MTRYDFMWLLTLTLVPFAPYSISRNVQMQSSEEIVLFVDWSMDGSQLAVGFQSSRLEVFDVVTGESVLEHSVTGAIAGLQWSPTTPSQLAVGIADVLRATGSVEILDTSTGQVQWVFDAGKPVSSVTWRPDGAQIAAACNELFDTPLDINEIKIWDSTTGEQTGSIPPDYPSYINEIAWSPGGDRIAGGSSDGRVFVWDAGSGAQVAEMTGHTSAILGIAWAPDNQLLGSISFGQDNTLRIWDSGTRQELRTLYSDFPQNIDWNGTLSEIALREAGLARIIDPFSASELMRFSSNAPHRGIAFSPFGARLAYGGEIPSGVNQQGGTSQAMATSSLAQGMVQIVVPDPSPAGLEAVAIACGVSPEVTSALTASTEAGQFEAATIEMTRAEDTLPPGCAADMQAVIDAMAAG